MPRCPGCPCPGWIDFHTCLRLQKGEEYYWQTVEGTLMWVEPVIESLMHWLDPGNLLIQSVRSPASCMCAWVKRLWVALLLVCAPEWRDYEWPCFLYVHLSVEIMSGPASCMCTWVKRLWVVGICWKRAGSELCAEHLFVCYFPCMCCTCAVVLL